MNIALVYNPAMAQARLQKVAALARLLAVRGHQVGHFDSKCFDAVRDCRAIDLICVCGGDGTAQLVIANQADPVALPPLAIYPIGTINLLARELGYPTDPQAFAVRIESRATPLISRIATVNGRPFLCCVSVGGDAHAVAALSEPLKARIGRLAYVAALAKALLRWPRQPMTIETDAGSFIGEALFVLRGHFYAGPWNLAAEAALDNDMLQLIVLPRARRRDLAGFIVRALTGSLARSRQWPVHAVKRVSARARTPVPVQIDGDAAGTTPLEITMNHQSVRFA